MLRKAPVSYNDGKVDLLVTTSDVWTLTPDITLGRAGGENKYGFGILEENLFGRGQKIGLSFSSDVDRDTIGFDFRDNNLGGSRYQLAAGLADSSDGHEYDLLFSKPFYALDARRSNGLRFLNGERIDQLYDLGEVVAEYNNRYKRHEAFLGWSAGLKNDWARRYFVGVAYEENVFSQTPDNPYPLDVIPQDRKYLYPFFGMQFLHDHYEKTVNFDQISRTEDRHLGLSTAFRIGYSSANAGSSESAWHFSAGILRP